MNTIISVSDWLGFSGNIIGAAIGTIGAFAVASWQNKRDRQNSMDSSVYVEVYKELNKMDKHLVQFIQYNFVIKQMLLNIRLHRKELLSHDMIDNEYLKSSSNGSYLTLRKVIDNINNNSNLLTNELNTMISSAETFSLDDYGNFTSGLEEILTITTGISNKIYWLNSYYFRTSSPYYADYPPAVKNIDELIDSNDVVNDKLNELRKTIKSAKTKAKK